MRIHSIKSKTHSLPTPSSVKQKLDFRFMLSRIQDSISPSSQLKGYIPRGRSMPAFFILPQLLAAEAKFCVSAAKWWLLSSSAESRLMAWRLYLGQVSLRILRSQSSLSQLVRQWFHAERGKPRRPDATSIPIHWALSSWSGKCNSERITALP